MAENEKDKDKKKSTSLIYGNNKQTNPMPNTVPTENQENLNKAQEDDLEENVELEDFGTYENYDVVPDEQEIETEAEEEEEEQNESDMAEQIEEEVKAQAKNEVKKQAGQAIKQGAKKAGSAIVKALFTPPVLWFTLAALAIILIVLLIVLIVYAVGAGEAAHYENCDPANGIFATADGIMGDKFYGARVIYLDPQQSSADLKMYYEAFATDFIENMDNSIPQITVKIDLSNPEVFANYQQEMAKLIAKAVANPTENIENATIEDYISSIDHFGYTNLELDRIQKSLIEYVNENMTNSNIDDDIYTFEDGYLNFENDANTSFDGYYQEYNKYNITAPLYYVKDVIIDGEEEMLGTVEPKNIVALIYMPKTSVEFVATSHMFYFPSEQMKTDNPENESFQNWATSVSYEFVKTINGEETVVCSATADPTWWQEDHAETKAEVEDVNCTLQAFNSINKDNLTYLEGQNMISFYFRNDNYLFDDTNNNYFKVHEVVDGETGEEYREMTYLPKQDTNYLYVRLSADGVYQFCEYSVEYN